jgi:hypothetical protein
LSPVITWELFGFAKDAATSDPFSSATYGFRVKTVDFEIGHEPFAVARERLTEVY